METIGNRKGTAGTASAHIGAVLIKKRKTHFFADNKKTLLGQLFRTMEPHGNSREQQGNALTIDFPIFSKINKPAWVQDYLLTVHADNVIITRPLFDAHPGFFVGGGRVSALESLADFL